MGGAHTALLRAGAFVALAANGFIAYAVMERPSEEPGKVDHFGGRRASKISRSSCPSGYSLRVRHSAGLEPKSRGTARILTDPSRFPDKFPIIGSYTEYGTASARQAGLRSVGSMERVSGNEAGRSVDAAPSEYR